MEWDLEALVARRDVELVPGLAVGVMADGRREICCDGITSVETPSAVDEHTLFQLGSVSKLATATALLVLVDRGALGLDDLVAEHLTDVDFGDAASELTIEHLLTHRGGWQGDWSLFNAPSSHDAHALRQMVKEAAKVPRFSEPGGPFGYDNFGTCVAGAVVEQLTALPFDDAVRELVLEPLDLRESCYWADDAIWRKVALGHASTGGLAFGSEPWADMWPTRRALWPQGGLVTSVSDALEFATAQATGTASGVSARVPISSITLTDMHTPRAPSGGQGTAVALGWHVRYASGEVVLTHTGAGQGYFARMVAVPGMNSAMVALTNSANGPSQVDDIFDWYLHDVLNVSEDVLLPEQPPAGAAALIGTYATVGRTIHVPAISEATLTAVVEDTGPTWGGTSTFELGFRAGERLESADGTRMEYGTLRNGRPWLRYRGRVHTRA